MGSKKVIKTFKYRIYPNKEQQEILSKHFGCCRFIYNYFLNERKEYYLTHKDTEKKTLNYYDNAMFLPQLKEKDEFKWLKKVNAQSLQQSLRYLDEAYNRFFRRQANYPKFKSKNEKQSFVIPQNFRIEENKLHIPRLKTGIKVIIDRPLTGKPCSATISKNKVNQYHVSITTETEHEILPQNKNIVGIDLGIKTLVTTSNGKKYENLKTYHQYEKKLKYAQRQVSKKKKGSNSRKKAIFKLSRIHNKIKNIRENHLHQISHQIISENQVIISEDLSVANMLKNHKLAKSIQSASWGELIRQLNYKAEWNERLYIKVDRFFPSSKMCSCCGFIINELPLNIREWKCPKCETIHDRDVNAARNIEIQGMNLINQTGCGMQSVYKQKLVEALAGAKSMKPDVILNL